MTMMNEMNTNMIEEAEVQMQTMLLTSGCTFDNPCDFASSVHNFVRQSVALGETGVEFRSSILRANLKEMGYQNIPTENFVFFGGRTFLIPTAFLSVVDKQSYAEKMAQEDFEASNHDEEVSIDEVERVLLRFAAMDDESLSMYTEKLHELSGIECSGNFTLLRDGSVMSLHYLEDDDDEHADEYDLDEDVEDDF